MTIFIKLNEKWNAEPNAPDPKIEIKGNDLQLSFFLNYMVFNDVTEEDIGILIFRNCIKYRLGYTNDEGWYKGQCRFSKIAPEWGEFYEIIGDGLFEKSPNDWKEIINKVMNPKHFLFYFRDDTFECIAEKWEYKIKKAAEQAGGAEK